MPSEKHHTKPNAEYRHLTGHYRTDGVFKTDEQLRMEYIHLTDRLISKIIHGVDFRDRITGDIEHATPEKVIFLDKSARPVAWLMKELWSRLAVSDDGTVAPMPGLNFLNIDKEQWLSQLDPNGTGELDFDEVDNDIIRGLRSIFIEPRHKENGTSEGLDSAPSTMDHRRILVVDEVQASGKTLAIAQGLVAKAFPTASVAGAHWMGGQAQIGSARGNLDLPVWYNKATVDGRGVGDRMVDLDSIDYRTGNLTQRLGAWFLSTRRPDELSRQIRSELRQLATDPSIPAVPDMSPYDFSKVGALDEYNRRLSNINGGADPHEIQARINEIKNQK